MLIFKLVLVNQVRAIQGKEHAKFAMFKNGKQVDSRWFNNTDIRRTIKDYPEQKKELELGFI